MTATSWTQGDKSFLLYLCAKRLGSEWTSPLSRVKDGPPCPCSVQSLYAAIPLSSVVRKYGNGGRKDRKLKFFVLFCFTFPAVTAGSLTWEVFWVQALSENENSTFQFIFETHL